jgi:hypothetical protein
MRYDISSVMVCFSQYRVVASILGEGVTTSNKGMCFSGGFFTVNLREVYLQTDVRFHRVYKQVYGEERTCFNVSIITFGFEFIALFETNFIFLRCRDCSVSKCEL